MRRLHEQCRRRPSNTEAALCSPWVVATLDGRASCHIGPRPKRNRNHAPESEDLTQTDARIGESAAGAPVLDENAVSAAVVFDNVSFAFDEHVVLRDISFSVPKGSMRILLGASGAGKSVVLKLILGLLRPDAGTILVNGQRVDR